MMNGFGCPLAFAVDEERVVLGRQRAVGEDGVRALALAGDAAGAAARRTIALRRGL